MWCQPSLCDSGGCWFNAVGYLTALCASGGCVRILLLEGLANVIWIVAVFFVEFDWFVLYCRLVCPIKMVLW